VSYMPVINPSTRDRGRSIKSSKVQPRLHNKTLFPKKKKPLSHQNINNFLIRFLVFVNLFASRSS
jgi:hypothetical protein